MLLFMKTNSKERKNSTLPLMCTRNPKSLFFTFYTGSLHMTSYCLCSKVVNNISRNFKLCDFLTQGYARIHFNVQYCIRMEIKIQILYSDLLILNTSFLSWTLMFIYFVYCIIGHLLQGSGMEQPLYKH